MAIYSLAEPLCKVNPFPQQSKISNTGNVVKDCECNINHNMSNATRPILWRTHKNIGSDQMIFVLKWLLYQLIVMSEQFQLSSFQVSYSSGPE